MNSWLPTRFHHERNKKTRPAAENLRSLRQAIYLAEEVGKSLG